MKLDLYQIDAFASKPFEGNPAAVCPLDEWLPDDVMQSIAAENNLSETAFFVKQGDHYHIRWFAPVNEVDLCGHATLASAYVIFNELGNKSGEIVFDSRSGSLIVRQSDYGLDMDFPALLPKICHPPAPLVTVFAEVMVQCLKAMDYIVVLDSEASVLHARPDLTQLAKLDLRGVAITAHSEQYDFVSRFFAPRYGINEDPVTGSAFSQLIPYWAGKLNKTEMTAKQVSSRGGEVHCVNEGERVTISGRAVKYLKGSIEI